MPFLELIHKAVESIATVQYNLCEAVSSGRIVDIYHLVKFGIGIGGNTLQHFNDFCQTFFADFIILAIAQTTPRLISMWVHSAKVFGLDQFIPERLWEPDVLDIHSLDKQRSHVTRSVTGDATSDGGDKEGALRMLLGIVDEALGLFLQHL